MADAAVTLPDASAEAVRLPLAETVADLVAEVEDVVKNPDFEGGAVVRQFNRGLGEIVARLAAQGVYLPSLAATGEVTAVPDSEAVVLPPNWHGNLHGAWNMARNRRLHVLPWEALQRRLGHGAGQTGMLHVVAVFARQLRYWRIPTEPTVIRIHYHRLPSPLLGGLDKAAELPAELSTSLLINYACWKGFESLETEVGDPKANTTTYKGRFDEGLKILAAEIGPWPTAPVSVADEMGWGCLDHAGDSLWP